MSTSILGAYALSYGSRQEVAEAIAATLREAASTVDCTLYVAHRTGRFKVALAR